MEMVWTPLSDYSYPSWVPDFGIYSVNCPYQHSPTTNTAASLCQWKQVPSIFETSRDFITLHIWARTLEPCKVFLRFEANVPAVLRQLTSLLRHSSEMTSRESWTEGRIRRIARACVSHVLNGVDFTTDEILEEYDTVARELAGMEEGIIPPRLPESMSCQNVVRFSAKKIQGKTIFMLANGCFGIGGCDIEDGDVVTLPLKGGTPLVLRRENEIDNGESLEYYRMVGNAYVDGVMEGESLDTELVAELEKQSPQEVLIR